MPHALRNQQMQKLVLVSQHIPYYNCNSNSHSHSQSNIQSRIKIDSRFKITYTLRLAFTFTLRMTQVCAVGGATSSHAGSLQSSESHQSLDDSLSGWQNERLESKVLWCFLRAGWADSGEMLLFPTWQFI